MSAKVANGTKSASGRFELPALNLDFGSITDGTNIPPPPDSPVEKPAEKKPEASAKDMEAAGKDAAAAAAPAEKTAGEKAGANEGTVSNGNGAAASVNDSRPQSRSGGSFIDDPRKAKRSSGWFRRLRGGESKRSSLQFEQSTNSTPTKPSGPPPPMIPELKDLEKDDGGLGNDLFKNIK